MTSRLARLCGAWVAAMVAVGVPLAPAWSAQAPRLSIASFAQLPTPLPYPYDEHADATAAVAGAMAAARAGHRRLLIDLGGDWCPDCRVLAGTLALPEAKAFVERHFVVVTVDVGRFDHNLAIPAHYGVTRRLEGVPSLLIIDPNTDKLLDEGHIAALADARAMTPQALVDWLAQWTP